MENLLARKRMSDPDLRQISLGLYQYLCRHVVGTEDTVRTKRLWNALRDRYMSTPSILMITSGSFGEGIEMKGSDLDFMYVLRDVVTFQEDTEIKEENTTAAYFQILTNDTKLGFVKLLLKTSLVNYWTFLCERVGNDFYLSNVLFKNYISTISGNAGITSNNKIHGPCLSDNDGLFDNAYCLRYDLWINQANQWITRPVRSWPSPELKRQLAEHGVLFVPIGVKGSPNENIQWRISFSVGEKMLIYSFTHTQLACYALMKIVLKDLINRDPECEDLLCSYFIKNIMFWLSEELPISIWKPDNLVPCFMQCLERLIYCVEYSMCMHYFIPENNMFENKIEGKKRRILLDKLYELYSFNWKCILLSPQLQNFHHSRLPLETQLSDTSVYFEQIMRSVVLNIGTANTYSSYSCLIGMSQRSRSKFIRHLTLYFTSKACIDNTETVQMCSKYNNKKLYRKYKTCQYYLMQGLNHDVISGWLLAASMFYRMKQYRKTLDILSYAMKKCSPDKIFIRNTLSPAQRELLRTNALKSMGLVNQLNILFLNDIVFGSMSFLVPNELEIEVMKHKHRLPPVVYINFLSFLCYYHLHDLQKCKDYLTYISLTIQLEYFTGQSCYKATSYNCLGVAFQLIGEIESARKAFLISAELDKSKFNTSLQRLSMTTEI